MILQMGHLVVDPVVGEALLMIFGGIAALGFVYLLRIHIAWRMAKKRHRDPLGWILLSFFFSPLLTWIILLIVGDDKSSRPETS
ncbi:MAG: hypothetical protein NC048_04165 [Bacteroides sp.]|nr:hypothetical protein [Bacteroides sp.]MCM1531718.1 hypothetical protein [Ruminococcus flavefaciens]MCM1554670.1 hypothetical protein [Bacteroides sp.]